MRCPVSKIFLAAVLILVAAHQAYAQTGKVLETRFATIHYADETEINGFFWRLSGKHVSLSDNAELIKNRLDELVERVEQLLEMYPSPFHFTITLRPKYAAGNIAEYSHRTRSITVFLDRVTDGILAHEMAHAVMNAYFPVPPPEKAQEILAQYVDKHLYEEPL